MRSDWNKQHKVECTMDFSNRTDIMGNNISPKLPIPKNPGLGAGRKGPSEFLQCTNYPYFDTPQPTIGNTRRKK